MKKLPEAKDGKCTNCGSDDMVLIEHYSEYNPCTFKDGEWSRDYMNAEFETAKFYCADCGTHHAIPEELS
jgi:hypothetical protein